MSAARPLGRAPNSGAPVRSILIGSLSQESDSLRRAVRAVEDLRAAADRLEAALDEATAAGLRVELHVMPPLGAREGWRVEVEGAGW